MIEKRNPLRQLIKQALVRALPRRAFMASGRPSSGVACLTFDDGPHPEHTPRLLDVLAVEGVKATFFIIGEHANEHPELVRRMADEGHAIGGHSYTHSPPESTSASKLAREVQRTCVLLERLTGRPSNLFRPPHGKLTGPKLLQLWRARQTVVLWNVDPKDFARSEAREVAQYFEDAPLAAGDIALLHDTHPHAAEIIPDLVKATRARGVELATVERLIRP